MGTRNVGYFEEGNAKLQMNSSPVEKLIMDMIRHQEAKVFAIAREIIPHVTPEDLLNPQDFPALERNSRFNFEDGLLAGLKATLIAVRSEREKKK